MKRIAFAMFFGLVWLLAACSSDDNANVPALPGTEWVLDQLGGQDLVSGTNITLRFDELALNGYAGCNYYGADYRIVGDELRLGIMNNTVQDCADPAGVMAQEAAYLNTLRRAATFEMTGEQLIIRNGAGEARLVYARRRPTEANPKELIGTGWALQAVNEEPFPQTTTITLRFDTGDALSGFAGCRDYEGRYRVEQDQLAVAMLSMVQTDCDQPQAIQEQEDRFLSYLDLVTYYRLSADQLELITVRGDVLRFAPASST